MMTAPLEVRVLPLKTMPEADPLRPSGPVPAPKPVDEALRLRALRESAVLDTPPEQAFDDLTTLASAICGTPIALVSLVDEDRQWFKSRRGLDAPETSRDLAFCAHALLEPDRIFEIADTERDQRFAGNPLVTGDPHIRFYAGAPILSAEGFAIGTLCVIDRQARALDEAQRSALAALARTAAELLRGRRQQALLQQSEARYRQVYEQALVMEGRAVESEARFLRLAQSSPLKMWTSDARGGRTFLNRAWCEFVGQPMDAQTGQGWLQCVHADDRAQAAEAFLAALAARASYRSEYRLRREDGGYRWHVDAATPRVGEDGAFLGLVGSVVDVHDQREATAELERLVAERTAMLDAVLQSMPSAVIATDIRGRVLVNNRAAQDITGYASAEIPMDTSRWPDILGAHTLDDRPLRFEDTAMGRAMRGEVVQGAELLIHNTRRSQPRIVEANGRPLLDAKGQRIGALVVYTDIDERKRSAEILAASEAKLRLSFKQAPLFQGIFEVDGRLREGNDIAFEACGLIREQQIGRYAWDCGWWSPSESSRDFVRRAVATAASGRLFREEGEFFTASGECRHEELSMSPMRDARGRIVALFASGVDTTERRRSEQALVDSEARFRAITDVTPQILWTCNAQGSIDFLNGPGLAFFGQPIEVLRDNGWRDFMHPQDLVNSLPAWEHSLRTGALFEQQFRFRRADGEYRWHIARGVPQFGDEGRPRRWFGVCTDIEDLKRAQHAAEAATEAKSQFLANMSHEIRTPMNGVIGMTSVLEATELSPAQHEYLRTIRSSGEHLLSVINDILDFSRAEAGRLDLELHAFDLRACIEESMELVGTAAHDKNLELILDAPATLPRRITGDAGRLRQVLVNLLSNAIKFTDRGEVVVRVEVAREAREDRGWRLRFVVEDSGIGIPADRMDRLFGTFSQVDPSHTRTYGGSGLGLAIAKRLVECMSGRIWAESVQGQGSQFGFEIEAGSAADEGSPCVHHFSGKRALLVDDNHTHRRVLRLMLQAWGLQVVDVDSAQAALDCAAQQSFDLALLDFQMPQMTGLQLALALRRLPAHGELPLMLLGSIGGEPGHGFSGLFVARMLKPLRQSALLDQLALLFAGGGHRAQRGGEVAGSKPSAISPLRILIAEDNSVNQKVALRFLERLGYGADVVGNGAQVVEAVLRQRYDVVLMDVQMPEMDGFEATRQIRRRMQPGPWIIAVTANALSGDERRCREAGMDDYLRKPIDPRELATALQRVAAPAVPPPQPAPAHTAAAAPLASTAQDYDRGMLAQLESVFEADGARELIQTMHDDLPRQLAELEQALQRRDRVSASRVMHSLKSTVRMVHAAALGDAMELAERRLLDEDAEPGVPWVTDLLQRCRVLMERLLDDLGP